LPPNCCIPSYPTSAVRPHSPTPSESYLSELLQRSTISFVFKSLTYRLESHRQMLLASTLVYPDKNSHFANVDRISDSVIFRSDPTDDGSYVGEPQTPFNSVQDGMVLHETKLTFQILLSLCHYILEPFRLFGPIVRAPSRRGNWKGLQALPRPSEG